MDNDLMARRLRPPSEPIQPKMIPSATQTEQPDYPPQDGAQLSASTEESGSPRTPAPAQPETSPPMVREGIPWDRPTDYTDPTDSAATDQPAWDRPSNSDWFDTEPVDDRTPVDDPMSDVIERPFDTIDEDQPLVAWQQVSQPPMAVSTPDVSDELTAESVAPDPDDAYAPVLGDVSVPMTRAWPEMNGHDAGRNDATVATDSMAVPPLPEVVFTPLAESGDWPEAEAQAAPEWQSPEPEAVAEAVAEAAPEWPEPEAVVEQFAEAAPEWQSPEPEAVAEAVAEAEPVAEAAPAWPEPEAVAEQFAETAPEWQSPEPQAEAESTSPAEAPGQTSWFSAVEPTGLVPGLGPTPPVELFDNDPVDFAPADSTPEDSPEWQAFAEVEETSAVTEPEAVADSVLDFAPEDTPDWHDSTDVEEAYVVMEPEAAPEPAPESAPSPAPQPAFDHATLTEPVWLEQPSTTQAVTPAVLPYSTAPAPARPFVANAKAARLVSTPDLSHDTTEDVTTDAENFAPRHPEFEPRGPVPPVGPVEPVWIEPTVPAYFDEHAGWLDPGPQSQPQSPQAPWGQPSAPMEMFREPTAVPPWAPAQAQPTAVPPWASAPSPAPAPTHAAAPQMPPQHAAGLSPVAPQTSEFALPPTPMAMQAPAPFEDPAPPWAKPTYAADPLAQLPAAQASAPSPFAPSPFAPPVYAPPPYIEPLPATVQATAGPITSAAPQVTTIAQDQSDLWFLSTEPGGVAADGRDDITEGREPSPVLTGILTIGMAVLVIVLVLVFIQLMTSLLR